MKKMKGLVSLEPSPGYVDQRTIFKHQSLLQDYAELEKETDVTKKRLLMMKQRKLTLLAEVRFLRRRFKCLTENNSTIPQAKQAYPQLQNYENRSTILPKVKNSSRKESSFRNSTSALDLNQRKRTFNGVEANIQRTAPVLELNRKVRSVNRKEASLQRSKHNFNVNQQDKRKKSPAFDLNQISTEEEELQANFEPLRREELKKSLLNDDKQNDMKLLACRNIGNESNRNGKRKISWQDQVALRV